MYAWGGSTSGWARPDGYKHDPARAPYLDKLAASAATKGPRSYLAHCEPNMALVDPKGKNIHSDSKNPIIVAVDVTGSMASWPGEIFDRLPLFYQTLSQYRDDAEFCFAAIGDAHSDQFPIQVNHFGKGVDLEEHVKALGCEGGGGGQISESYELFGHFILNHCQTPNATSPFLLIFGDEKFYNTVNPKQVQHYIGDTIQSPLDAAAVWQRLIQKFNVYFLHKPYGSGGEPTITAAVKEHWERVLGPQRVVDLPSMDRAVDVAMGIVAKHWGEYDDFGKNLSARQTDPNVRASVHHSLRHLPNVSATKSVMGSLPTDGKSKSLLDLVDE